MSSFSISRSGNGQVKIDMKNLKDHEIDGVGNLTGSATLSVGNTGQKSNETAIQIGQTQDDDALLIAVDDDIDNIELYGTNLEARFDSKTAKQYNVQWDARNSVLDSTQGNASILATTNEKSSGNTFLLGHTSRQQSLFSDSSVDNMIVDSGKNNTFISDKNSANYFETTETSLGAKIYGGDGDNTFMLSGDKGFVVGGKGDDYFVTGKNSSDNMIFGMDGDDYLKDYGNHNFFGGGKGVDTVDANGHRGLYNLGKDEKYVANLNNSGNSVFSKDVKTDENGNTYVYQDYIEKYLDEVGMNLAQFKEQAGLSESASYEEIFYAMMMR